MNIIIVAGNAWKRRIIKNITLNSELTDDIRVFSGFVNALDYISDFEADALIIDPLVEDINYRNFVVEAINLLPDVKLIFAIDSKSEEYISCFEELMECSVHILEVSFSNAENSELYTKELTRLIKRYDYTMNRIFNDQDPKPQVIKCRQHNETFRRRGKTDLVVIISSTGGPAALEILFSGLKKQIDKPIVIIQHMPEGFTEKMCERLQTISGMTTIEGYDGLELLKGNVVVAPGSYHLILRNSNRKMIVSLLRTEKVNGVRPAADVFFHYLAKNFPGANILTVVLTGMGNDGTNGIREIKERCNCYCISQSERTSVVYGMPRAVYEADLCDEVLDIEDIHRRVIEFCD